MLPAIDDPLLFSDSKTYGLRLRQAREETGQHDSVMLATGKVNNVYLVAGAMNFNFMGGSVGRAAGEAFVAGAEFAYSNKLAYVFFSCSGGMRMQESNLSLMQMPRMIAAINSLKQEKLPFISVCLDPTTGGTTASVALLGDINIAEPKALIAFAGARVIKETVREELPKEFQKAEYLKDKYDNPIYEGDIVKWDNLNYLVEWNDIAYKWQGRCPYYHSYHHPTTEHFRDLMNGVIVGNYFENNDLLK